MLALAPVLIDRLRAIPALAGWDVRGATEPADRRALPAIDVRWDGASMPDTRAAAMLMTPQWSITLVVRRGASAAAELDAAFEAVFSALHGWAPTDARGRTWRRLEIQSVSAPVFAEEGQAGMTIAFTSTAFFKSEAAAP